MQCHWRYSPVTLDPTASHPIHIGRDEGCAPNWSLSPACIRPWMRIRPVATCAASNRLMYYLASYFPQSNRVAAAADGCGRSQWMRRCCFSPHQLPPDARIFDWRRFVAPRTYQVAEAHQPPLHSHPSYWSTGPHLGHSHVVQHSY